MIKILLGFLGIFLCFYFGIEALRELSGKERLNLTKSILYSMMCASGALGISALIVFLF